MATFGQFMRTTVHNFRMFWSASFGPSGRPLKISTEEPVKGAMDEEQATINPNDWSGLGEDVSIQHELSAVGAEEQLASDSSVLASEVASTPNTESDGFTDAAPELDTEEDDSVVANPIEPQEDELATDEPATAEDPDLTLEPAPLSNADDVDPSSTPEDDDELVVQGELKLEDTEGELSPDIQIESHGKLLGVTTLLESLLFVSDEPVEGSQLARVLNISTKRVEAGLQRLDKLYASTARGLRVQVLEGRYQLVTAPEAANAIEDFLNLDLTTKLSGPALEALAVIAYRQPVTRAQVEAVRGVDCAGVLRSLTQRGLVEEMGRLDSVGRPILYGVTDLFMQHFGLIKLGELPPLETDDEDMLWAATKLAEMEQDES